jgi:hypothetical protein
MGHLEECISVLGNSLSPSFFAEVVVSWRADAGLISQNAQLNQYQSGVE